MDNGEPMARKGNRAMKRSIARLLAATNMVGVGLLLAQLPGRLEAQLLPNQSVQGTPTGSGFTFTPDSVKDRITINTPTVVIDWTAADTSTPGTIDFLPTGRSVVFQNNFNAGVGNYTVLNRITALDSGGQVAPSQVIALNGTVESRLDAGIAGVPVPIGGSVWFYTPGGFLVGSTGVINVGNLVLSTSDIATNSLGTGTIHFTGTPTNTSSITIAPNATIAANNDASYVAMVAPRIVQSGSVSVNGSLAYVAAEAADITINAGLFDIAVTTGSGDANGVVHQTTGNSGGPASTASAGPPPVPDYQNVFMVAVPKSQAMTMLLGGSIGHAPAANADLEGSAVVLSAGYGITGGTLNATPAPATGGTASMTLTNGSYSNVVAGSATGNVLIQPSVGLDFAAAASFTAVNTINVSVGPSASLDAASSVSLLSSNAGTPGSVSVQSTGGTISVAGALALGTSAADPNFSQPANGLNATAGAITLRASGGGTITTGSTQATANATGGGGTTISGTAVAGQILVETAGGTLNLGSTTLSANANVAVGAQGLPITGSNATGGTITINGTGGALNLGGLSATAIAQAGSGGTGNGGDATGGNIILSVTGGTHTLPSLNFDVSSFGGASFGTGAYGGATGGTRGIDISVSGTGSSLSVGSGAGSFLTARSQTTPAGASGRPLQGGTVAAEALNGGTLSLGTTTIDVSAAQGATNLTDPKPATTTVASGGLVKLAASGGALTTGDLFVDARAQSGDATGTPGGAMGGTVDITSRSQNGQRGALGIGSCNVNCGVSIISTTATGASGLVGGAATGGTIDISAQDADLTIRGLLFLDSNGTAGYAEGPAPGESGAGTGGSATIATTAGLTNDAVITFDTVLMNAEGSSSLQSEGVAFNIGNGGSGSGGTLAITVPVGTFNADTVEMAASGVGGASGAHCITGNGCTLGAVPAYLSGVGHGGTAAFTISGGTANINSLTITANGTGGTAQNALGADQISGIAGAGTGGSATLALQSGTLNATSVTVAAAGTGGGNESQFAGVNADAADGGDGTGGNALLLANGGTLNANSLTVIAEGVGGDGGSVRTIPDAPGTLHAGIGGTGTGGTATALLAAGAVNTPSFTLSAAGSGGFGGDNESDGSGGAGGTGRGGTAIFTFASEGHTIGDLVIASAGLGGTAGFARSQIFDLQTNTIIDVYGAGAGGQGGSGTGGSAAIALNVDPVLDFLTVDVSGTGAAGANGTIGGAGGDGVGGTLAGGARLDLFDSSLTVVNATQLLSDGTGGRGGDGFVGRGGNGGAGTGGDAGMRISGPLATFDTTTLRLSAVGTGGDAGTSGVQGGSDLAGANGGLANGGTVSALFELGSTSTISQTWENNASALGGAGGTGVSGLVGGKGGNGGDATGGTASITVTGAHLFARSDSGLSVLATGTGGTGGNSGDGSTLNVGADGGNAGAASGGTASLETSTADFGLAAVRIAANGDAGGVGVGGMGGFTIPANGAAPAIPPSRGQLGGFAGAFGGTARFLNTDDGTIASGAIRAIEGLTIEANGTNSLFVAPLGGHAILSDTTSAAGGTVNLSAGDLVMRALGFNNGNTPPRGIQVTNLNDPLTVRNADFATDGQLRFDITGRGTLAVTGNLSGYGGESIFVTHSNQPATPVATLSAGRITLYSTGLIAANAASILRATGDIIAYGLGDVSLGAVNADGSIGVNGFSVTADRLIAGEDVAVASSANISVLTAQSGDDILMTSSDGSVTVANALATGTATNGRSVSFAFLDSGVITDPSDSTNNHVQLNGKTGITANVITGNYVDLAGNNGPVLVRNDLFSHAQVAATGAGIAINSLHDISFQLLQSTGDATVTTTGSAGFTLNTVTGTNISITSRDIAIDPLISMRAADQLTLRSSGSGAVDYIGGADHPGAYSLSGSEMARLYGQGITIAPQTQSIIGSFAMSGGAGGNLPSTGRLAINSAGRMSVEGAVSVTGLSQAGPGGVSLASGNGIDVVTDTGSIAVPGGTLSMSGASLTIATRAAITDITGFIPIGQRDARLAQNDGPVSDQGFLNAGTINLNATEGIYVQNTGADTSFDARRGFTADVLNLFTAGATTEIIVNGRLASLSASGMPAFKTGLAVIPLTSISNGYATGSTINGCLIAAPFSCGSRPDAGPQTEDIFNGPQDEALGGALLFPTTIVELREFEQTGFPPLIDEPVTGAGNDDLWETGCDPAKGGHCE